MMLQLACLFLQPISPSESHLSPDKNILMYDVNSGTLWDNHGFFDGYNLRKSSFSLSHECVKLNECIKPHL